MLHKLLPSHPNKKTALVAEEFMKKLNPDYQLKVTYDSSQSAIPLRQADVYPDPIEMKQADVFDSPIMMQS